MYTQCPNCSNQVSISTEDLRASRGMLKCDQCAAIFDALEYISDQPIEENPPTQRGELFPERKSAPKHDRLWRYGFFLGLLLLFFQFFYFEAYALSQNQTLRPWLLKLCRPFGCSLPDYKNTDEISILQVSLEAGEGPGYRFKAVIINQARYSQPYPDIRLTLLDFTGAVMAERVFFPLHYHPASTKLAADASEEIVLDIVVPDKKIGGYSFKLL